ncbi:reverse transcriptase [Lasius niger]|uniref:Reverse transcriptase n=1 Tax=Lasius niger TaxID=67767 RepID=A0A0J7KS80_LASNI|nr:reverse transcriptase [Lasius niger]
MELKVLQINAQGFISVAANLKKCTEAEIDVIVIQESYAYKGKVKGYATSSARTIQPSSNHPQVAIIVLNQKIDVMQIDTESSSHVIGAYITTAVGDHYLIAAYFQYSHEVAPYINMLENMVKKIGREKRIICADVNANSVTWNSKSTDDRGEKVEELITDNRLIIIKANNPPTYSSSTGASLDGRWDLRPIRAKQTYDIQESTDATLCCPKCSELGLNISCIGSRQLNVHMEKEHFMVHIIWSCAKCSKRFPKVHAWRCHYAVCKGEVGSPAGLHQCEGYPRSFNSRTALSQHERNEHSNIRNQERTDKAERPAGVSGRKLTVWTEEELRKLKELSDRFQGERNINVKLMEYFPDKTNKQISDARRRWRPVEPLAAPPLAQEEEPAMVPADALTLRAEPVAKLPSAEPDVAWKGRLIDKARKPYEVPNKWEISIKKLYDTIDPPVADSNIKEVVISRKVYGEIMRELIRTRKSTNEKGADRSFRKIRKHARKRPKTKPPNRVEKRQYAFAKCQKLMNKCPKMLADAVAANDLSLLQIRQPPKMADIKELYTNLWGTPGPKQEPLRQAELAIAISDILLPVTPEEVSNEIKRIANISAAGVDGIVIADLKGSGISVVLSKLYNILFLHQAYSEAWKLNRTTLIPKSGKDLSDGKNWRPLTISSMLSRIFSSLLDRCIRRVVKQSARQKEFTDENGCFANTRHLSAAIAKAKESGGIFAILDISKAFDTVSMRLFAAPWSEKEACDASITFNRKVMKAVPWWSSDLTVLRRQTMKAREELGRIRKENKADQKLNAITTYRDLRNKNSEFPSVWKIVKVELLLKDVNKDPRDINTYRPIALLSVIGKLYESILVNRIQATYIEKALDSRLQFGFKKKMSTEDDLLRTINEIENS